MLRFLSPLVVILTTDGAVSEPDQSIAVIDLIGILLSMPRSFAQSNTIVTVAFGFEEGLILIPPDNSEVLAVMLFNGPLLQIILPTFVRALPFVEIVSVDFSVVSNSVMVENAQSQESISP